MKKSLAYLALIVLLMNCSNTSDTNTTSSLEPQQENKQSSKIKVYLLGSFHFSQTDSTYNVLDEKHQKSIKRLCKTIANQNPDKVFIETQPEFESQNRYDSLYKVFINDNKMFSRGRNEIFQIGFRVAKILNHQKVYQCDNPGRYGFYYSKALKYAQENNQMKYFDATTKGTVLREDDRIDEDSLRMNSTLFDYIKWLNSDVVMRTSHASYIVNDVQVGNKDYYNYNADDTLLGAEIVADWYRRNIMIYTKMINQLSYDEEAIFLVMGADHIPTLTYLFNSNPYFEVVDPKDWLK